MNYFNTFIAVATDTSAKYSAVPPLREGKKSIAVLEYELIAAKPYALTQEGVQFAVHIQRKGVTAVELKARRTEHWQAFFSKPMACMRALPLPKLYGWSLHFNAADKYRFTCPTSNQDLKHVSDSLLPPTGVVLPKSSDSALRERYRIRAANH